MTKKDKLAYNVVKAWVARSKSVYIPYYCNLKKADLEFFNADLKKYGRDFYIVSIDNYYHPYINSFELTKILQYLYNHCNDITRYYSIFNPTCDKPDGTYFIFDNIAFKYDDVFCKFD